MSTKRKRTVDEPSAPFITFVVKRGDREIAFDRVLEATNLTELRTAVAAKLRLPDTATINFTHLRGEDELTLEDDEDFEAFAASTTHYNHSRVKIDLPETSAAKEAPPRKPKATAPVKIQKSAADAKNPKRRKKTSNTSEEANAVEELVGSNVLPMDVEDDANVPIAEKRKSDTADGTRPEDEQLPEGADHRKKKKRVNSTVQPETVAHAPIAQPTPESPKVSANVLPTGPRTPALVKPVRSKPKSSRKPTLPGPSIRQSSPGTEDTLTENHGSAASTAKLFSPEPGRSYPTPQNRLEVVLVAKRQGSRPPHSRKSANTVVENDARASEPNPSKISKAARQENVEEPDDKEPGNSKATVPVKAKRARSKKVAPQAMPACSICHQVPGHENFQCPLVLAALSGDNSATGLIKERGAALRMSDAPQDTVVAEFLDRIVIKHDQGLEEPKKKPRKRKSKTVPATDDEAAKEVDVEEDGRGRKMTNRKSRHERSPEASHQGRPATPSATRRTRSLSRAALTPAPEPIWVVPAKSSRVRSTSLSPNGKPTPETNHENSHIAHQSGSPDPVSSPKSPMHAPSPSDIVSTLVVPDSDEEYTSSSDGLIRPIQTIPAIRSSSVVFSPPTAPNTRLSPPKVTGDYRPIEPPLLAPQSTTGASSSHIDEQPSLGSKIRPRAASPSWTSKSTVSPAQKPVTSTASESSHRDQLVSDTDSLVDPRKFLNKLVLSTSTSSGAHGKNGSTRNRKQVAQSSPLPRNFKPKILATSSTQPSQGQTGLDMFPSLESLSQQGINNLHGQPHRLARPSVLSPPKPTQQEDTEDEDSSDSEDESIPQNRRAGAGLLPSRRKSGLASFA